MTNLICCNPVAASDEERDEHDQPSCSALEFAAASVLIVAACCCPASETGWQPRFFVCRVRRLTVDDVPSVQVQSEGGSDQADGRHICPCPSREGRGRGR